MNQLGLFDQPRAALPRFDGSEVVIDLTKGAVAIVDQCDSDVASRNWYLGPGGYATRGERSRKLNTYTNIFLHRVIAERLFGEIPDGLNVDHTNRVRLDCRRSNLRLATTRQNNANSVKNKAGKSSIYRGVYWVKSARTWSVQVGGKTIGYFKDELEAGVAADRAALMAFGEFAILNFPPRFGSHTVEKRNRGEREYGLYEYRLIPSSGESR